MLKYVLKKWVGIAEIKTVKRRWWKGKQEEIIEHSVSLEHKSYHPRQTGCHQSSSLVNMVTPSSCSFSPGNTEGEACIAASNHCSWYWQMVITAGVRRYPTTNYQRSTRKNNIVQNTIFHEKILNYSPVQNSSRHIFNVMNVLFVQISI